MKIFRGSQDLDGSTRGCVLTVGNFDGLHLGHQALLRAVKERGEALAAPTALYTFDPHPRRVLYPERSDPQLMPWDQLMYGLEGFGIDVVIREQFTLEFAALSPEAFLQDVLAQRIAPRELFVGRDFHFGKGRRGSGETLARLAPTLGVQVDIIAQVTAAGGDVSSSRIRRLLGEGEVAEAAECLGRPYTIWGTVVEGAKRGRTLGFPTANLDPENELIPCPGVYATEVQLFEGDTPGPRRYASVTNIGTRPTFEPGEILAEAHLIDFDGDLYGQRISLAFRARVRLEQRFSGPEALAEQIRKDVAEARRVLA